LSATVVPKLQTNREWSWFSMYCRAVLGIVSSLTVLTVGYPIKPSRNPRFVSWSLLPAAVSLAAHSVSFCQVQLL
jgi:hypothetical protein